MGLAGPVDPAAALAVSTVTGDVRKAMTFGALFLSSALLHAAEVSITTLYPWKVKEFAEEERGKGIFTMLDRDITRVLSTVLIATTICNILSTAIFTEVVARRSRGSLRFISLATSLKQSINTHMMVTNNNPYLIISRKWLLMLMSCGSL